MAKKVRNQMTPEILKSKDIQKVLKIIHSVDFKSKTNTEKKKIKLAGFPKAQKKTLSQVSNEASVNVHLDPQLLIRWELFASKKWLGGSKPKVFNGCLNGFNGFQRL